MDSLTIRTPDTASLSAELSPIVQRAALMMVRDVPEHEAALTAIRDLRSAEKRVEDAFGEPKSAAHKAHKAISELEKKILDPLVKARKVLGAKCDLYEGEARRKAEEERRAQEDAARRAEEERKLLDAIAAESDGNADEAEAILAEPVAVPVIPLRPAVAKVEGVSTRQAWRAEVCDLLALVRYVAEHPEWIGLVEPNGPALNALARSQRDAMAVPGVRAVAETIRAAR